MRGRIRLGFLCALCLAATAAFADGAAGPSPFVPVLSSYIQLRYIDLSEGGDAWAIRRLKLMFDGGPSDGLYYHLQFIYKTNLLSITDDQVFLQDAYVVVPLAKALRFKIGQFVPPFGLERFQPDWKLDLVDRTDVTNRMVVNGNLGKSFARDRGVQADWAPGGWRLSAGLFQGGGANMNNPTGNGPLGVARASYEWKGKAGESAWFSRLGVAVSDRHDNDMNFIAEFPGLNPRLTSHFYGRDSRLNVFAEGGFGKVRGQAELFRTWLSPRTGAEIAARGAYAQMAYLPASWMILALRYEWFTPDVHEAGVASQNLWTAAVTVDVPKTSLRLALDYSHPTTGWPKAFGNIIRAQIQWILPSWHVCGKRGGSA